MSRRSDDDLAALLDELSGTLDQLRTELDDQNRRPARDRAPDRRDSEQYGRQRDDRRRGDRRRERTGPQIPRPGQFLQFTEEYTIPALIAFLEANIKALELLRGLLRVLNGGGDVSERRVESVGRRTLGQVDDLLGDVQGALEGQPSNPEARDLLADARALREDIDQRISSGAVRRESGRGARDDVETDRGDRRGGREGRRDRSDAPVTIDVSDSRDDEDADRDRPERRGEDSPDGPARRDEVDVDSELDSLRRQVRGDDGAEGGDGSNGTADDDENEN